MKANELKLRIQTTAEGLINTYFGNETLIDRLTNSTLKLLVRNNSYKLDNVLKMFADKDGEIDAKSMVDMYANAIGDGIPFDIKNYVENDFIRNLLPNKTLLITKEDLLKIIPHETAITVFNHE